MVKAGTKFVKLSHGIEGEMGSLVVDETYVSNTPILPLDALIVDLSRDEEVAAEIAALESIGHELL